MTDLRTAAEGAEALLLRLRRLAFDMLAPDLEQSQRAFAVFLGELESAPELEALRVALGRRAPLPPAVTIEED